MATIPASSEGEQGAAPPVFDSKVDALHHKAMEPTGQEIVAAFPNAHNGTRKENDA